MGSVQLIGGLYCPNHAKYSLKTLKDKHGRAVHGQCSQQHTCKGWWVTSTTNSRCETRFPSIHIKSNTGEHRVGNASRFEGAVRVRSVIGRVGQFEARLWCTRYLAGSARTGGPRLSCCVSFAPLSPTNRRSINPAESVIREVAVVTWQKARQGGTSFTCVSKYGRAVDIQSGTQQQSKKE